LAGTAEIAAADAAAAAKIKNDEQIAQDQKNLEAAKAAAAKADERLMQPHHWGDKADTFERGLAEDAAAHAQTQIIQYTNALNQARAKKEGLDTTAGVSQADYEAAKAKADAAAKRAAELEPQVADLTAQIANLKAQNATLANLHNQTAQAHAAAETPGAVSHDAETKIQHANEAMTKAAQTMAPDAISALADSHAQLVAFIGGHPSLDPAHWEAMERKIADTQRELDQISRRQSLNRQ